MMQLLDSSASPFCRKARVVIIEAGLSDQVEVVGIKTTVTDTDGTLKSQNPLGKIPALVRPDGPAIYDSRVICRYLDAHSGGGLYPEHRLWETLTLEATGDGIMEAAVLIVYEARFRPEDLQSDVWTDAQWEKVTRALDAIEAKWMSHLHGKLDAGQIAVGCALGYLDFRHGPRDWRKGRPALAAWFEKFSDRPSMKATVPPAQ